MTGQKELTSERTRYKKLCFRCLKWASLLIKSDSVVLNHSKLKPVSVDGAVRSALPQKDCYESKELSRDFTRDIHKEINTSNIVNEISVHELNDEY